MPERPVADDERDRRAGERVPDEDHIVVHVAEGLGDELGVPREARVRILDREINRDGTVPAGV